MKVLVGLMQGGRGGVEHCWYCVLEWEWCGEGRDGCRVGNARCNL